ncbi:MAG TPA: hypothetical protein VLJ39_21715, partial [Tepidisphaeraceae bacterium]|nr:hypothetical protein [Tepidisphaeraceae bacterium]
VADPNDAKILYGAFEVEGVHKSTDGGKTWTAINDGIRKGVKIIEVAISPANSSELFCIGSIDWNGYAYWSDNGGTNWHQVTKLASDHTGDPTSGMGNLSAPTNVTYCPTDPKKLYISSNWRPVFSDDAGRSWQERDRGADISCVYDIRFSKHRAYAACMDEGVLFTKDDGSTWQQAWPGGGAGADQISGHFWRIALSDNGQGVDRIVSTCSPWNANLPNRIVLSDDGGKTYKISDSGLPAYRPHANTMWGQSYPRALAVDPTNPRTLYLGMDGDSEGPDKPGGGIFKSTDGGSTWARLPHQPGALRVFFGLAVDPTDPKRLYWGACGTGGGLYRSDDAGESWQRVFQNEQWLFNVLVAPDGTVYAPGQNLWRSADHGQTWKKLTNLPEGQIMGLEVHPHDPRTLWLSTVKHGGAVWGQILKTTDGGATWQDITGDIGFRKPAVLRFNPETNELWAGGVGLFKVKQ